jgi:hypothetical protein
MKELVLIIEEIKLEAYILERRAINLVKKAKKKGKLYLIDEIRK